MRWDDGTLSELISSRKDGTGELDYHVPRRDGGVVRLK